MVEAFWQPLACLLVEGFIGGVLFGFAARKLNKVIAALVGALILALNVLWFARMLGGEAGPQLLRRLADALFDLLPFSPPDVQEELRPVFLLVSRAPFLAGFLLGSAVGFKLA